MPIVDFVLFSALFYAIALVFGWLYRRAFVARFPPMTDEEFAERCRPGTDPAIALRVRRVLAESLAIPYESIDPSHRLMIDLGAE